MQLLKAVPGSLTLGWGDFEEQPTNVRYGRYLFDWLTTPRPYKTGNTTYSFNSDFRQTVYDDPYTTALYYYNVGLSAQTNIGPWTNLARFGKLEDHGYTPFQMDVVYPNQTVTDSIQYQTSRLNLTLTSGLDLNAGQWQDVTFVGNAMITKNLRTSQTVGYDFNDSTWRDLVSKFTWKREARVALDLGGDYDMQDGRMRTINADLIWQINANWRLKWLGSYDFSLQQMDYDEFLVTRDLHCWDISACYSEQQQYFYVYLRLKALNIPLPQFGLGRGGQVLSANQGPSF